MNVKEVYGIKAIQDKKKEYVCLKCDDSFSQEGYLVMHNTIKHERIKPNKCSICSETFSFKRYLKIHMFFEHEIQTECLESLWTSTWILKSMRFLRIQNTETNKQTLQYYKSFWIRRSFARKIVEPKILFSASTYISLRKIN